MWCGVHSVQGSGWTSFICMLWWNDVFLSMVFVLISSLYVLYSIEAVERWFSLRIWIFWFPFQMLLIYRIFHILITIIIEREKLNGCTFVPLEIWLIHAHSTQYSACSVNLIFKLESISMNGVAIWLHDRMDWIASNRMDGLDDGIHFSISFFFYLSINSIEWKTTVRKLRDEGETGNVFDIDGAIRRCIRFWLSLCVCA